MTTKEKVDVPSDLSVREACLLLNVGRPKVEELIKDGVLTAYRLGERTIRIKRETLEAVRNTPATAD